MRKALLTDGNQVQDARQAFQDSKGLAASAAIYNRTADTNR